MFDAAPNRTQKRLPRNVCVSPDGSVWAKSTRPVADPDRTSSQLSPRVAVSCNDVDAGRCCAGVVIVATGAGAVVTGAAGFAGLAGAGAVVGVAGAGCGALTAAV